MTKKPSQAHSPTRTPAEPGATLEQIFDQHAAYAHRALRHFGVPEADLEDLCQEVFLVVHRKLASFEGRSALRTWIYGICQRCASDHRRRAHVRRERADPDPASRSVESASQAPDARVELRATLERLLGSLDQDKREVLVLYEIEGLSMKEVAKALDCPLQTAYSRLHAARARLLAALEEGSDG